MRGNRAWNFVGDFLPIGKHPPGGPKSLAAPSATIYEARGFYGKTLMVRTVFQHMVKPVKGDMRISKGTLCWEMFFGCTCTYVAWGAPYLATRPGLGVTTQRGTGLAFNHSDWSLALFTENMRNLAVFLKN